MFDIVERLLTIIESVLARGKSVSSPIETDLPERRALCGIPGLVVVEERPWASSRSTNATSWWSTSSVEVSAGTNVRKAVNRHQHEPMNWLNPACPPYATHEWISVCPQEGCKTCHGYFKLLERCPEPAVKASKPHRDCHCMALGKFIA